MTSLILATKCSLTSVNSVLIEEAKDTHFLEVNSWNHSSLPSKTNHGLVLSIELA